MGVKFFYITLFIIAFIFLFVPILANPTPKDCTTYPDGAGGYYVKCKDTHTSLYKKYTSH